MEYYTATKKNKLLKHSTTRMILTDIMLIQKKIDTNC